ncbi:MAG: response regulator transcription factor [Prolixibacteraceae bacterium]|nr:response regulator transcription factor [Prolixibacteraceae bacterium]
MLNFAFIVTFILSVSMAALGILLSENVRKKNRGYRIFTILMYQQILMYVFAFYAIWGQLLIKWIISDELENPELTGKILYYLFVCAIPFLLFSWWFHLDISFRPKKLSGKIIIQSLSFLLAIAIGAGYLFMLPDTTLPIDRLIQSISIGNLTILATSGIFLFFNTAKDNSFSKRLISSLCLLFFGIVIAAGVKYYPENQWLAMFSILIVFTSAAFLPFIFNYVLKPEIKHSDDNAISFISFCEKFGISKREAEIIEQVCAGLTNQEIADKLFITLQTVKDHVSRIYLKTSVRNRTELANLVRENQ